MDRQVLYKMVPIAGGVALAIVGGRWLINKRKQRLAEEEKEKRIAAYPPNTVMLHHIGRAAFAPCLSQFTVKLETYLRITGIPYKNISTLEPGPKGKIPYIYYNGQVMGDSQFIIEYLNKEFGKDLNKHLTTEQKAVARAFQKMFEENTYWCVILMRGGFLCEKTAEFLPDIPKAMHTRGRKYISETLHAQGLGRHTEEEVNHILKGDLAALSGYLDKKKFLMGDEPCEADCAIFGQLAQLRWCCPDFEGKRLLSETFTNLDAYCERMKSTFWPDWDDCTSRGKPSEIYKLFAQSLN